VSEQIERFDPSEVLTDRWEMGSMESADDGDYVRWEDYDQLAADNKRLREALKSLDHHNDNPARYDSYIDEVIKYALSGHPK
jgi:hypothetical protein